MKALGAGDRPRPGFPVDAVSATPSRLLAAAILVAVIAHAHAKPAPVVPASNFRDSFVAECVDQRAPGTDAGEARSFCSCAFEVIADSMTLREFLDLDSAGRDGASLDSFPQFARIKLELDTCKRKKDFPPVALR